MGRMAAFGILGLLFASVASGEPAAQTLACPVCKYPCTKEMLRCWSCGSGLSGRTFDATKFAEPDTSPVQVTSVETRDLQEDLATLSPELALAGVEQWIADHPGDLQGAIQRLKDLLERVRGSPVEASVEQRLKELSAEVARASAPKSPQERIAEAARAYTKVMEQVRREPDRVLNNIKLLEDLLKIVEGTPYEQLVRKQIEREKAKTSR